MVDNEGFHYKYVPKDSIIIDEKSKRKKSFRKGEKGETNAYIYVKKNPANSGSENNSAHKSDNHGSAAKSTM